MLRRRRDDAAPGVLHRLLAPHGDHVRRAPGDVIAHGPPSLGPPVWVLLASLHPGAAFVFAEDSGALHLTGDGWMGAVHGFHAERDRSRGLHLRHPTSGRYLSAQPAPGPLTVDRASAGAWERFVLGPPCAVDGLARAPAGAEAILRAGVDRLAPDALLDRLRSLRPEDADAFQAWARLLDDARMEALAVALAQDARAHQRLAALAPQGAWALSALHGLPTSDRRAAVSIAPCGPEYDRFADGSRAHDEGDLARLSNRVRRRRFKPARNACVVACARDEGPYLVEWIAYHRAVGFDRVIVYSNDNSDGSDDLLAALARHGAIAWRPNVMASAVPPQFKAFGHALKADAEVVDHAWAAFIDLDEFVSFDPVRFPDVNGFLAWHAEHGSDVIGLNWRVVGSDGAARWSDRPVLDRFHSQIHDLDQHIKSIFRPQAFSWSGPHNPEGDAGPSLRVVDSRGDPKPPGPFQPDPREDAWAWVDHYAFKSAEEFILRRTSNRGDGMVAASPSTAALHDGLIAAFLHQAEIRSARPKPTVLHHRAAIDAETSRLMALPGVADARAAVAEQTVRRIAAVRAALEADDRAGIEASWANLLVRRLREG